MSRPAEIEIVLRDGQLVAESCKASDGFWAPLGWGKFTSAAGPLDATANGDASPIAYRLIDVRPLDRSWLDAAGEEEAAEIMSRTAGAGYMRRASVRDLAAEEADTTLPSEEWRIERKGDKYLFRRYCNGKICESYRSVTAAEAAVWAAAVIQGFEPPRHLSRSDKPVG